jgi:predicted butyrate kinase (DUF1464 family)
MYINIYITVFVFSFVVERVEVCKTDKEAAAGAAVLASQSFSGAVNHKRVREQ